MALELIKISEFPESVDTKDWFVVGDVNGVAYKLSKDNLEAELGINALMQFGGAIVPASTPEPTGDFFWVATEEGPYTNFGGIVVPSNSIAVISRVGGAFTYSITEIQPQDLSYLVTKEAAEEFKARIDIFNQGYIPSLSFTDTQGFGISNQPYSDGLGIRIPANTLSGARSVYAIDNWNVNIDGLEGKTVTFEVVVEHSVELTTAMSGTMRVNLEPTGFVSVPANSIEILSPTRRKFTFIRVMDGTELSIRAFWTFSSFTNAAEITFKTVSALYSISNDIRGKTDNTLTAEELINQASNTVDLSNYYTKPETLEQIDLALAPLQSSISDKQIKVNTFDLGFLPSRGFADVNGIVISNQPYSDGDALSIPSGMATGTPSIYALQQFSDSLNYPVGKKITFSYILEHPVSFDGVTMTLSFRHFVGASFFDTPPIRITRISSTRRLVEFEHVWLGTETRIQAYWGIGTSVTAAETLVFKTITSNYYISDIDQAETSNTIMVKELVSQAIEDSETTESETIIKVSKGGSLANFAFVGNRAIQDAIESITDATATNTYRIKAYGLFEALTPADYDAAGAGVNNLAFIRGKDYVNVDLIGDAVIKGFLTDNLGAPFNYQYYQTIYWNCKATLTGGVVTGKNVRYPIHIDGGTIGLSGYKQKLKNVKVWHLGNTGDAAFDFPGSTPVGTGMSQGQELVYEGVELHAKQNGFYFHTNIDFNEPSVTILRNSALITDLLADDIGLIRVNSNGSGQDDEFIMEGNSFDGGFRFNYFDDWARVNTLDRLSYNHSEIKVKGFGNDPFHFHIDMKGFALRIKSKSTGNASSVRLNPNTSGFEAIFKDKNYLSGSYTDKYGEVNTNGYAYRDGGGVLSGYALGRLDIGSEISDTVYIKSLGKRLGDCTTVNKTLEITIDGVLYTVTFNKNYNGTTASAPSAFTNAQIIAEITSVIGAVATVSEYTVGNDYYPELTDVLGIVKNVSLTDAILRGMAVVLDSNKIRKATETDTEVYGIALDDFLPDGYGRVLKRGYIWSLNAYRFYALTETPGSAMPQGTELGVSATDGVLSTTATIKLFKARENNVISVNC